MSFFSIRSLQKLSGPDRIPPGETDGSGPVAVRPSTRRALRRDVPLPPAYIPSTWDKNGTRKTTSARSIVCRYAKRRSQVRAFFDHLPESPLDFGELGFKGRAPGVDDDIPLRAELGAMQAEGFAESALDAVADDGSAEGAGSGESQACTGLSTAVARQTERREQGA